MVRSLRPRYHVSMLLTTNLEPFVYLFSNLYICVLFGASRPGTTSLLLWNPSSCVIETHVWHPRDAWTTIFIRWFERIPMPWWPVLPVNHQEDPQGCSFGKPSGVGVFIRNYFLFYLFVFPQVRWRATTHLLGCLGFKWMMSILS